MTKEQLLDKVSVREIFDRCISEYAIKQSYCCPYHNERTPSFSFKEKEDKLFFKCFGCGKSGDVFTYLMDRDNLSFPEVLKKIARDLNISNDVVPVQKKRWHFSYVDIAMRKKFKWKEKEFAEGIQTDFWLKYGITLPVLQEYDVRNISHYSFKKDAKTIIRRSGIFNPVYGYFHNHEEGIVKFYKPFAKSRWEKFTGNTMSFDIFGLKQIKERQEIIVWTAGEKDALSVYANTGIRTVCTQSESTLPMQHMMDEVKQKCDKQYVLYDNDRAGKQHSERFKDTYGTEIIDLNTISHLKDISLYYEHIKEHNYDDKFKELISAVVSG